MEEQVQYFMVHHPVGRLAPLEDKVTLVEVMGNQFKRITLERDHLLEFENGKLKVVDSATSKYYQIDELNKEIYQTWYRALTE